MFSVVPFQPLDNCPSTVLPRLPLRHRLSHHRIGQPCLQQPWYTHPMSYVASLPGNSKWTTSHHPSRSKTRKKAIFAYVCLLSPVRTDQMVLFFYQKREGGLNGLCLNGCTVFWAIAIVSLTFWAIVIEFLDFCLNRSFWWIIVAGSTGDSNWVV